MKKILLFGSATADITLNIDHLPSLEEDLNPSHQTITLGGCACNAAMMLKLSEVPFTLAVPVGTGLFGDFVRTQLQKRSIPIWKESEEENGSCTCLVTPDGSRTFLAVHGGEYHYRPKWLESLHPEDYSMVYICGIDLEEPCNDCLIDWLEQAHLPVCFACGPRIKALQQDRLERIMALHPIIHCNAEEAEILLGRIQLPVSTILKNARMLSADTDNLVVITDGERGCVACNDDETLSIPSFPVKPVDGTGAGDSHIGPILACLYKGYSLKRSLSIASIVSAAVIQRPGAVLSRQEYEKLIPSFPQEEEE